jgi:hypothetical protein
MWDNSDVAIGLPEGCSVYVREDITAKLREALEMVRDADEDRKRDGLETMPHAARAKIDAALKEE